MNRAFKGIWIPKEIWESDDLTLQEKVMIVEIDSLDNDMGCFASNQYFSDFFGISTRRITDIISSLVDKGYIHIDQKRKKGDVKSTVRVLTIKRPPYPLGSRRNLLGGVEGNFYGGVEGNFQHNNTYINNKNNICPPSVDECDLPPKKPKSDYYKNIPHEVLNENGENDISAISFVNFEKLYSFYPKKVGKQKAFQHYVNLRLGVKKTSTGTVKLSNKEIFDAMMKYLEEKGDTDIQYLNQFDVFLNTKIYDYLEE